MEVEAGTVTESYAKSATESRIMPYFPGFFPSSAAAISWGT